MTEVDKVLRAGEDIFRVREAAPSYLSPTCWSCEPIYALEGLGQFVGIFPQVRPQPMSQGSEYLFDDSGLDRALQLLSSLC